MKKPAARKKAAPRTATARTAPQRRYWLDERRNVDRIYHALLVLCFLAVGADFFYSKHVHYAVEDWPGSYGFYGFVCCVALVLLAKALRRIVMRPENYYDDAG